MARQIRFHVPVVTLVASVALSPLGAAQSPFRRTFVGGTTYERVQGVTVDAQGLVYITGHTTSSDFYTHLPASTGGFDTNYHGDLDGFVAVLNSDLTQVLHWTGISGSNEDRAYQVEIDSQGQVVVVGFTDSPNFPRTGGPSPAGGWDVFVARFSHDLTQLNVCTLLGGSQDENPRGSFCLDSADNLYVGGHTSSFDFPTTPGVFQPNHAPSAPGDWDGFVAAIAPNGMTRWATYIGGQRYDASYSGARLQSDGSIVIAGMTDSVDFPVTPGAFQKEFGGHGSSTEPFAGDGFVACIAPGGASLIFSTFLGGSEVDSIAGNDALELDSDGCPIVIGLTDSSDFPVTGVHDSSFDGAITGKPDAFVARLSKDGSQLLASTYLGGEQSEEPSGLAIGPGGEIVLSGNTRSGNFPTTPDANQAHYGGGPLDGFVVKLSSDLRWLVYSSFVGGSGNAGNGDRCRGLTLTPAGDVLIGGDTDSTNLAVSQGTYDTSYNGGLGDGFVSVEMLAASYAFGVGKTSSIGSVPRLRAASAPSLGAGSMGIDVVDAVPQKSGCLAFGRSLIAAPYQGGIRYMGLPVVRVPGAFTLDFAGATTIPIPITPEMLGETRFYQAWYRDPTHVDGTRAGLTNALKVTFVP